MKTIGDILHIARSFLSLRRTKAVSFPPWPTSRRLPPSDPPPSGQYHNSGNWEDERKARLALATSWAYAGIMKIGLAGTGAEFLVKRREGEEFVDIPSHPMELLFRSPNPDMSGKELLLHTIISMELHASYWFLYPDERGDIAEIWPIPFGKVRPVPNDSENPESLFAGFAYLFATGKEMMIPPENVIYLRYPNPFDPYSPLPPLRAIFKPVVRDQAQSSFDLRLFDENKGVPAQIVSVPVEVSDTDYEILKQEFRQKIGESMFTRGGAINVEVLGATQKDMQFQEGREFNKQEIWETLGIPPNVSEKDGQRHFIDTVVWPLLTLIAGQISTQLTMPFYGENIIAEFKDIRPQDRAIAVQEATQNWPKKTFAEVREEQGDPALPPLIVDLLGDQSVDLLADLPIEVAKAILNAPVSFLKPTPSPLQEAVIVEGLVDGDDDDGFSGAPSMPGSAGPDHAQEQGGREAEGIAEDVAEAEGESAEETAAVKAWQIVRSWQVIAKRRLGRGKSAAYVYENEYTSLSYPFELATVLGACRRKAQVDSVFSAIEGSIVSILFPKSLAPFALKAEIGDREGEINPLQMDLEDDFEGALQSFLNQQSARIAQATAATGGPPPAAFWTAENAALAAFLTPFIEAWTEAGTAIGAEALADVGLGLTADVNARVANWAGRHALELAKGIDGTTRELAKAKIKNFLQTGKPLSELQKDLAEVISPQWRADMIAQTEVTNAFAQVNLEIADELDVIVSIVWNTARDERVCPICGPLEGETIPVGGVFPGGFASPPAHPRCRCGTSFRT